MVFLMYHELETEGRRPSQEAPGYVRYVVGHADFSAQMNRIRDIGMRGVNLDDALSFDPSTIAITFDDGCETDLTIAAPILKDLGFDAIFYITTGFLGKPGHLTAKQVCELSDLGFQIGCHSMTHAYLSDLDENSLRREILDSKAQLEQLTGKKVAHFSCPGGRYNQRTAAMVRQAEYRSMATSQMRSNSSDTNHFDLARIPVMRATTLKDFDSYCHGRGLWSPRLQELLRNKTRLLLGNTLYDRLRESALNK